jgi:hypothetical protein
LTSVGRLLSARFLARRRRKCTQSGGNNNAHGARQGDFRRPCPVAVPHRVANRRVEAQFKTESRPAAKDGFETILTSAASGMNGRFMDNA